MVWRNRSLQQWGKQAAKKTQLSAKRKFEACWKLIKMMPKVKQPESKSGKYRFLCGNIYPFAQIDIDGLIIVL